MRAQAVAQADARPHAANRPGHGWASTKNGKLLALAGQEFDVFLTADQNVRYQQNLKGRQIAILVLSTNLWPVLKRHVSWVQAALDRIRPGEFLELAIPSEE